MRWTTYYLNKQKKSRKKEKVVETLLKTEK